MPERTSTTPLATLGIVMTGIVLLNKTDRHVTTDALPNFDSLLG